jgi:hypothetical protein
METGEVLVIEIHLFWIVWWVYFLEVSIKDKSASHLKKQMVKNTILIAGDSRKRWNKK